MTYDDVQRLTQSMPYREVLRFASKSDGKLGQIERNFDKVTAGYDDWEKQVTARNVLDSYFQKAPKVSPVDREAAATMTSSQNDRGLLAPVPLEQGPSMMGFGQNVLKSAGRLASGLGSAALNIFNPDLQQNTVANVARLGIGAVANTAETAAAPFIGTQQAEGLLNAPGEQVATNLGKNFVQRYGDEGISKTLYEDPVGAMADVSSALGAAGGVARLTGAGKAGAELAGIASAADPLANASRLSGSAVQGGVNAATRPFQGAAERLYQSALKPTKAVLDEFPDVVQTGLKNGVMLTKGSLDDVKGTLEGLRQNIDDVIDQAAQNGVAPIFPEDVVARMQRAREFFDKVPGGQKYVSQLDDLANDFMKQQHSPILDAAGKPIPKPVLLARGQEMKKATYTFLNDAYGQLESAHKEGLKDIARGLKEEIVTRVPELKGLNLKQQELIGLERSLEDFVRRTGNTQIVDLGTGVGTVTGMAVGGAKGALKGFASGKLLKSFLDSPAFKSWRALVYYRLGKGIELSGKTSNATGKAAEALRVGQASDESNQDEQ